MIERRNLSWGSLLRPRDARGRESRTLFFVGCTVGMIWLCVAAVIWKFARAGSDMPAEQFAAAIVLLVGAFATALGIWLGREWIDAKRSDGDA